MYIFSNSSESPSTVPEWNHIVNNFIINGPSGNRGSGNLFPTVDNDDGSRFYYIAGNVLAYGGIILEVGLQNEIVAALSSNSCLVCGS